MPTPPIINDHLETVAKKFLKLRSEPKELLYFGLELEVERSYSISSKSELAIAKELKRLNKYLHIKRDGSISNGFELADQPQTLQYFYKHIYEWQQIFDILCKFEYYDDNAAGFHIHINGNYLTKDEIVKLYYFVHSQKSLFTKVGRRSGGYHYEYKRMTKVEYNNKFNEDTLGYGYQRNEALNITNLPNRGTLEFRLFRSTIDIKLFIATIEFVDIVVNYIKNMHKDTVINKKDARYAFIGYFMKHFNRYNCLDTIIKDVIEC